MSGTGQGIFSLQAVLISLAIHVVLIGGLFTAGRSGDEPPAEAKGVSSAAEMTSRPQPVERAEAGRPEKRRETAENIPADGIAPGGRPEKAETQQEKKGPVEIKIEPRRDDAAQAPAEKAEKPDAREQTAPAKTKAYVVKRGDTLTALARDCGLTIAELAQLNGKSVKKLSNLKVGQRLKLPAKD